MGQHPLRGSERAVQGPSRWEALGTAQRPEAAVRGSPGLSGGILVRGLIYATGRPVPDGAPEEAARGLVPRSDLCPAASQVGILGVGLREASGRGALGWVSGWWGLRG